MRRRTIAGLTLVLVAAGSAFLPLPPAAVERWYSTGIFPWIQRLVTPLSNAIPTAVMDPLLVVAAALAGRALYKVIGRTRQIRSARPLGDWLWRATLVAAATYLLFLVMWGFNYRRLPMQDRLVLAPGPVTSEAVVALGQEAVSKANLLHGPAHQHGWGTQPWRSAALRDAFVRTQHRLADAPLAVPGRLKRSLFGFYFRWAGIDGMVQPFALEVIGNPDLLPWEQPFVVAHEWAHLAGYAHEAEANFVGWLTCLSGDAPDQYSAWLFLYWQIASELPQREYAHLAMALGPGPRRDLDAIVDRMRRGQLPFLRDASWTVYDHYLRANRVESGVRSYGEVINLVIRTRSAAGQAPTRRGAAASRP